MKRLLAGAAALFVSFAFAGSARDFPAGAGAALRLELDDSWKETTSSDAPIAITAKQPDRFIMLLTPVSGDADDAKVRRVVEKTAAELASTAVEKSLPLRDLTGTAAKGYYFNERRMPHPSPASTRSCTRDLPRWESPS